VYHVFVIRLELDAGRVYLFDNGRANIEKNNREFLYDYPLGGIPTQSWKPWWRVANGDVAAP